MPGSQLESSFANLAYARLKERAPGLLDFLIGFQLLDKNEEETRAVGVFGFKIKDEWYYNPVFYLNGRLKGEELLYIKSQDAFVPLQENWVNYLTSRRPRILGEFEAKEPSELGFLQPDLSIFKKTDFMGKGAEYSIDQDGLRSMCVATPFVEKFEGLADKFHLPTFLKEAGLRHLECLVQTMVTHDKFAEVILKFYDFAELAETRFNAVMNKSAAAAPEKGKLVIVSRGDWNDNMSSMGYDTEKRLRNKLVTKTVAIEDNRGDDETTLVYDAEKLGKSLMNPDESGIFKMLMRNGDMKEVLVFKSPTNFGYNDSDEGSNRIVVVDRKTKQYANCWADAVFVTPSKPDAIGGWSKTFNDLPEATSIVVDGIYVLVNAKMEASTPFQVDKTITNPEGRVTADISNRTYLSYRNRSDRLNPPAYRHTSRDSFESCSAKILTLTKKPGAHITRVGNAVYVPESFKVIKLNDEVVPNEIIDPGNFADIEQQIFKVGSLRHLKVYTADGHEYFVSADDKDFMEPMSKDAALCSLVSQHGINVDIAQDMIGRAKRDKAARYFVKYARSYPSFSFPGTNMPTGFDSDTGVNSIEPWEDSENVEMPGDAPEDEPDMPDETRRLAEVAGNTGQKEVLDTSVLAGLVKTVDSDDVTDKYLGDILLGLDRVGRILFMFYWHNDKFRDRYGQQDMPELEDSLRNVFQQLGDLSLFLKQKTVEAEPGDQEAEMDLDEVSAGGM